MAEQYFDHISYMRRDQQSGHMASCSKMSSCVQMSEGSTAFQNTDQIPVRKSSMLKTGIRKTSSVTFGESNIVEVDDEEGDHEQEDKENDDKLRQNIENQNYDNEEEDVPITNIRRWTDSLKINRKKCKEEKIIDREKKDVSDKQVEELSG